MLIYALAGAHLGLLWGLWEGSSSEVGKGCRRIHHAQEIVDVELLQAEIVHETTANDFIAAYCQLCCLQFKGRAIKSVSALILRPQLTP